jgi:predicted RNA binding protein YcfA (HicA-like mRNA interferase family)
MKSVSGRELARLVERHGWRLLRVAGSHHIYGKPARAVHGLTESRGIPQAVGL